MPSPRLPADFMFFLLCQRTTQQPDGRFTLDGIGMPTEVTRDLLTELHFVVGLRARPAMHQRQLRVSASVRPDDSPVAEVEFLNEAPLLPMRHADGYSMIVTPFAVSFQVSGEYVYRLHGGDVWPGYRDIATFRMAVDVRDHLIDHR